MSWSSANLVPTSRPVRTEWVLGSAVPITPPPKLALTLHQPFNAFKHELTCSQSEWDNSCESEIQAEVITALVRQGDLIGIGAATLTEEFSWAGGADPIGQYGA